MIKNIDQSFYEYTGSRLGNSSFLKLFNLLYDEDEKDTFFNIWKSYSVNDDFFNIIYYETHEVAHNEFWDTISYKYYNTPYLWWVLAIINDVTNPFEFLEPGKLIYILKASNLYQILKEIKAIGEQI